MRSGAFKNLCHIQIYTVKWTYEPIWESIFSVFWASGVLKSIFPDLSAPKEARETKKIHLKFFIQKGLPPTWETTVHRAVCTRTGTVHEKCRGGVHAVQSRNIGDFLGPSQSSIRPIQPFSGTILALATFSTNSIAHRTPQTFSEANFILLSSAPIPGYLRINCACTESIKARLSRKVFRRAA